MPDVSEAVRVVLPLFFVLYLVLVGPWSIFSFRRRYGIDPLALGAPDPVMDFEEAYRNALFAVVLLMTGANAVRPEIQAYLGPFPFLDRPALKLTGMLVLVLSLVLIRVSQLQLGSSWRFGIDRMHPPDELIRHGVFARSRNPIYLGLILTGVGLFLAMPNAISLAVPNLAFVLLQSRVRIEELFMEEVFGDQYRAYRRETPRWLIRLGWRD